MMIERCLGYLVLAGVSLSIVTCTPTQGYSHLGIELSVAGLTDAQRSLVSTIVIESAPTDNKDVARIHRVQIASTDLDAHHAYKLDYLPDPQQGLFTVTVTLNDAHSLQLGQKTAQVTVKGGAAAAVSLDFVSNVVTGSPCELEAAASTLTATGGSSLALLWDIDHYLAVYSDEARGNGDLAAVKLDAMGNPLSAPVYINESARTSTLPSIVKDGTGYVVAWQEGTKSDSPPVSVDLRRLDVDGNPVGNIREIATTGLEARPSLVSVYGGLALAWMDDKGTPAAPNLTALVALLRADDFSFVKGGPIDLVPQGAAMPSQETFPVLAVDGATLTASWMDAASSVYQADIDGNLVMSTPVLLYTSTYVAQQGDMIATDTARFTAWEDLSGDVTTGRERIRGAFTAPDGAVGAGGIVHALDTGSANWPRLAWTGSNVAVVYYQYRDFGSQIFLTRYGLDGTRVDDMDIQLTNIAGQARYPQVRLRGSDFDGDHLGVGWVDDSSGSERVYFAPVVCHPPGMVPAAPH